MLATAYYYDYFKFNNQDYLVAATRQGLAFVSSAQNHFYEFYCHYPHKMMVRNSNIIKPYADQILDYLSGRIKEFHMNIDVSGDRMPPLERQILELVSKIPYGSQISSQNIALALNQETSVCAVEHGIKLNPLLFVVPTHRVIFAANNASAHCYGAKMLEYLLNLEGHVLLQK